MAEQNKGFIVFYDNEIIVGRLSDSEAGKLFKSLFPYATEHIKPDFENSPALAMAFDVLSLAIDRNAEWYKRKCEKNRENIMKRWNKNTNEYGCNESNTNEYGRVPNKEKEKEKEKEKDKEKDSDSINASFDDEDDGMDPMEAMKLWNQRKQSTDYQQIADMYNNTCVSFPRLTKLSDKRKKAIKARLRTYTFEDFQKLFEMAEGSSFLKGQNNRNWSATFDWLIADGNMAKVLDGNYTDKGQQQEERYVPEEPEYYKYLGHTPPSPDDPFQ